MDETDIKTFADITLSNRRLVQRGKIGGVKSLSSIPLSSYASSKMESVSKPYFVVLSALCLTEPPRFYRRLFISSQATLSSAFRFA